MPGGSERIVEVGLAGAARPGRVGVRAPGADPGDPTPVGVSGARGIRTSDGSSALRAPGTSLRGRSRGVTLRIRCGAIGVDGGAAGVDDTGWATGMCADDESPAASSTSSACMRRTSSAPLLSTRSRANARARRASPAASHACAASSWSSWNDDIDVESAETRSAMAAGSSVCAISATRARR